MPAPQNAWGRADKDIVSLLPTTVKAEILSKGEEIPRQPLLVACVLVLSPAYSPAGFLAVCVYGGFVEPPCVFCD